MTPIRVVLWGVATVIGLIWLMALTSTLKVLWTTTRKLGQPPGMRDLTWALGGSIGITVNAVVVLVAWVWYKARGKPLTPWPRPGRPRR